MKEIMTIQHPRWAEFMELLIGPEGCNFREKIPGKDDSVTWNCDASIKKPHARAILKKMGGFNLKKSFEYFESRGGYCDCEIVLNADPDEYVSHFSRKEDIASEVAQYKKRFVQYGRRIYDMDHRKEDPEDPCKSLVRHKPSKI